MMFTDFNSFLVWFDSDPGRALFGLFCWRAVGAIIEYWEKKHPGYEIDNDDKRLLSVGMAIVFSILVKVVAVIGGYADGSFEGWFHAICTIGFTAFVVFTVTQKADSMKAERS